jgi:hypothetical protein
MGTVYLLGEFCNEGKFKIGFTKNSIKSRLKQLQTGNSNEIFIVNEYKTKNYKEVEKFLHRKYYSDKALGEWFELSHEDVVNFTKTAKHYDDLVNSFIPDITKYDI